MSGGGLLSRELPGIVDRCSLTICVCCLFGLLGLGILNGSVVCCTLYDDVCIVEDFFLHQAFRGWLLERFEESITVCLAMGKSLASWFTILLFVSGV